MMFLSLGEVMLRFCPGDLPLRAANTFSFSEGGGEYNVARALSRCFGLPAGILTSIVDNEIGHLVHHLIRSSGVDDTHILWKSFDGIGQMARNPLYFAERGFGLRSPKACMDRGHSATSQLTPDAWDWDALFRSGAITWFHTGGIFAGLSATCAATALAAMQAAQRHGVTVSYDPNFRASLWQNRGNAQAAAQLNRQLAPHAHHLFGISPLLHPSPPPADLSAIESLMLETHDAFPQLRSIALGRRLIHSTNCHDYAASVWSPAGIFHSPGFSRIPVLDRIGSGDAFAAGFIAGHLEGLTLPQCATQACAAAALAMSTPGDALLCSRQDVLSLANSGKSHELR